MECSIFMKGTGIRLAQAGYAVFGIDYEGHGKSDGKRCYIESFQDLVDDSIAFFKSVRGIYIHGLIILCKYDLTSVSVSTRWDRNRRPRDPLNWLEAMFSDIVCHFSIKITL